MSGFVVSKSMADGVPGVSAGPVLRGRLGRVTARAPVEILRWLTGWAACTWVVRMLSSAVGFERHGELWLDGAALRVRRQTVFWGRVIRDAEEAYAVTALTGVRRHARYPALRLAVGAVAFGVGVLVGGALFLDALRTGTATLLFAGAIALALGAGLDLVLCVWLPGARGRVGFEVDVAPSTRLRFVGVDAGVADALAGELARRLEAR